MVDQPDRERCADCRFESGNVCRRFPPTVAPYPSDNQHPIAYWPATCWPEVNSDNWCGEFKRIEDQLAPTPETPHD